jgi:hypothetical protein
MIKQAEAKSGAILEGWKAVGFPTFFCLYLVAPRESLLPMFLLFIKRLNSAISPLGDCF